ncbi:tRNA dimethylallyltransferase [Seminavis robusta]|uniref:tRNA dimethylallyltransferase n=1 Tax=Seminavis robusta TaxID=568900 RepID=A0A9N8EPT1_9STRA|nr:tRNA dimethylallyltransferase [Seminavis robusta]|eukprot:Sro1510_g278660.1 tRNA dimethylallyltransferase (489) ;mRNA; r:16434-17900
MSSSSSSQDNDNKSKSNDKPTTTTNKNNLVVVLTGPTAVGKSDVAARICANHRGLIVSADSVQAYQGVEIGANKPTPEERRETPHMLVDVVDNQDTNYNAAEWQRDALHVIAKLLLLQTTTTNDDDETETVHKATQQRQEMINQTILDAKRLKGYPDAEPVLPVVVGGTMMYLQWLVHGRPDAAKPSPQAVQKAHEIMTPFQQQEDWDGAVQHVQSQGPIFAQRITTLCGRDWYRLRRTLEIALTVQEQQSDDNQQQQQQQQQDDLIEKLFTGQRENSLESYGYDVRCFFLCPDDRMAHTTLVDERCEAMITRGLLRETTNLQLAGQLPDMAARAIGYRQTLEYLQREGAKDDDEDAFQEYLNQFTTATRRYSKKQMQWFRKDDKFVFVPIVMEHEKATRVEAAAEAIQEMIRLPRSEYEQACFAEDSVSAKTMKDNEAQGKGMKFYQFKRYHLKPGTAELAKALEEADGCTQQIQAKRRETVNVVEG